MHIAHTLASDSVMMTLGAVRNETFMNDSNLLNDSLKWTMGTESQLKTILFFFPDHDFHNFCLVFHWNEQKGGVQQLYMGSMLSEGVACLTSHVHNM